MKKIIYILAIAFGLSSFSTAQTGETDVYPAYAYFFTNQVQPGVGPNQILQLTNKGPHNNQKYKLSSNGGFVVPSKGNYLISYRALINLQASLAVYQNEDLIPESAFANFGTTPVSGTFMVALNKNDVITIRSIETAKTFNTVIPAAALAPTVPVSVTIQRLEKNN